MKFYVDVGLCPKKDSIIEQFKEYKISVKVVEAKIDDILTSAICSDVRLRRFLLMHLVFNAWTNSGGDWLERLMAKILQPTAKELDYIANPPAIPENLLSMFSGFDIEPVVIEKYPIKVTYKMWGNPWKVPGESYDPIFIQDEDFINVDNAQEKAREFISSYQDISYKRTHFDDDIPF